MKTIGELKEFIKDLPNDMPLVSYHSDMEKSGYFNSIGVSVENMSTERCETWDRFDGGNYSYEIYKSDENGTPCLKIF